MTAKHSPSSMALAIDPHGAGLSWDICDKSLITTLACKKSERHRSKVWEFMRAHTITLGLFVLLIACAQASGQEQAVSPSVATGTLNLVLANKNGFVVITDSRKSSEHPIQCGGKQQLYCDDSQKLFRTTPHSAMMIAGFAAGRDNTPLDLAVASVIRKEASSRSWPTDSHADAVPGIVEDVLRDALTDVAAIFDPAKTPAQNLLLIATFVRFDTDRMPIVEVKYFVEQWKPVGPQNTVVPEYTVQSGNKKVTEFWYFPAGVSCVAEAILGGHYRTSNAVIESYYEKQRNNLLNQMTLEDMLTLAKIIMKETEKFTDVGGGEYQIGVFPSDQGNVQWSLPANLPSDAQLQPRTLRWEGITCSDSSNPPPCGYAPVSFMISPSQRYDERFKKFFLASQFLQIPIALDDNLFVGNTFDHTTLRWRGGPFFMRRNTFRDCVLELPYGAELPQRSELGGKCTLERKDNVDIFTIVGSHREVATPSMLALPDLQP